MGDKPRSFRPFDVLRLPDYGGCRGFRVWMVEAVCLGGLGQEGGYRLRPLDRTLVADPLFVPCQLLELNDSLEVIRPHCPRCGYEEAPIADQPAEGGSQG